MMQYVEQTQRKKIRNDALKSLLDSRPGKDSPVHEKIYRELIAHGVLLFPVSFSEEPRITQSGTVAWNEAKLCALSDRKGDEYLMGFTDIEELEKASPSDFVFAARMEDIAKTVSAMKDISGMVINVKGAGYVIRRRWMEEFVHLLEDTPPFTEEIFDEEKIRLYPIPKEGEKLEHMLWHLFSELAGITRAWLTVKEADDETGWLLVLEGEEDRDLYYQIGRESDAFLSGFPLDMTDSKSTLGELAKAHFDPFYVKGEEHEH